MSIIANQPLGDFPYLWQEPDYESQESSGSEDIYRYRQGGLHPVHLNDVISASPGSNAPDSGRYRILHKLGFGSYSHVWFGQNLNLPNPGSSGVALKFVASEYTGKTHEVEINKFLSSRSQQDAGFQNILMCLDTFQVYGPNGIHNVIITEPAIPISTLFSNCMIEHVDEDVIIQQILCGLAFLHKHGVVHTDLHIGNIAIEFPFLRSTGITEIMKASRHPVCHPIVLEAPTLHPPSLPTYIVERADFCGRFQTLMQQEALSIVVKIIDFGSAFRPDTDDMPLSDGRGGPPVVLRSPECVMATIVDLPPALDPWLDWSYDPEPIFNHSSTQGSCDQSLSEAELVLRADPASDAGALHIDGVLEMSASPPESGNTSLDTQYLADFVWSTQSDIWTLGCTLFQILVRQRHRIFSSTGGPGLLLRDFARYLGPIPEKYKVLLEASANYKNYASYSFFDSPSRTYERLDSQECAAALEIDQSLADPNIVEENWLLLEQKILDERTSRRMIHVGVDEERRAPHGVLVIVSPHMTLKHSWYVK
ncbi:kinase-like domain-containing protein [Mycena galericulata]|nr:kinase-like domain-containing protein [Mycena galericulata]